MTKIEMEVEEKGDGIFIPRKLLDELEVDEANVLIRGHEIPIRPKLRVKKLRGIVKNGKLRGGLYELPEGILL